MYPWGDFHSLNLGWFLVQYKEWTEKIQEYLDNGGGTSENLANVIAPVFNAENSYLTGDYVLYNDELYKANQAVNPGTWDPDAWTRCLVTEEMGSGSGGVDNVARLMIAGQYSNTYNYRKYAICRYNDKLWMCNTNLPAGGEEWEPSHWDEITVGAGLTGLRISVDILSNAITAINEAIADETEARQDADSELQNTIDNLGSNDIANESTDVSGTTVTNAFNNLKSSLNNNESAIAIVANGNTHNAIAIGQYVYIKNHPSLPNGLYKATSAIPQNATLTTTNVNQISDGGFNDYKEGTITPSTGISTGELQVKQYGRVVFVSGYFYNVTVTANEITIIGTLSGVDLPKNNIRLLVGYASRAYNPQKACYAVFDKTGPIAVNIEETGTWSIVFAFTYIT